MKVLQIVESAWRCTIEEQDDPALWICHAMRGAGAELSVLLAGNAVGYAARGQDASGLAFGGRGQTHPPAIDRDVAAFADKGVAVYAVEEDARERGIEPECFVRGVRPVSRDALPGLFAEHDGVWRW